MIITMISWYDSAQIGQRIAEAISRYTDHKVYNLNSDNTPGEYALALGAADVIWVTNDYLAQIWDDKFYAILRYQTLKGCGAPVKKDVLMLHTATGGYYRRPVSGYEEHSLGIYPLSLYKDNFDVVAPDTPEMIYPGMDNVIMPIPWPTEDYDNVWRRSDHIVVGAYQGMGEDRKGVRTYLLPAVAQAQREGIEIELLLSENCYAFSQEEYIKRMGQCDICFEEITPIGVYGSCGAQQLSQGIPIIANIDSNIGKNPDRFIGEFGKPCLKAYNVEDLVNLFRDISQNKIDLASISRESREYALRYHGYKAIAEMAEQLIAMAQDKRARGCGRSANAQPIMPLYNMARKEYKDNKAKSEPARPKTRIGHKRKNSQRAIPPWPR
jgi:hypothetical protein